MYLNYFNTPRKEGKKGKRKNKRERTGKEFFF
jgi:hypothetical protein